MSSTISAASSSSCASASLTPHGPGFSFIDTVEMVSTTTAADAKTAARATKFLDPALPFFAHHFPGQPLMPGVLMIEAAAQTAGWLWSTASAAPSSDASVPAAGAKKQVQPQLKALHLASVQGFRFLSPAVPGDTLLMEVTLDKELGTLAQFSAVLSVGNRRVAEGRLTLSRP
ncbi:MAG: 3-hydroxyacyl-ACP dehydratase FabZ family protein [Candidatus Methylacidiphilales bacterium]|nr:hypothetical protein [Candidatus Methylacidiphilales bacterium]